MELRIKELMQEKGITSIALSEKVGISKVAMSNIITGKSSPSLDNTIKIAEALGVKVSFLIGEEEKEAPITEQYIICPHCGKPIAVTVSVKV